MVDEVELLGAYPNPAQSRATVRFAVPETRAVTLRLYDVMGREVRTLAHGPQEGRTEMQVGLSGLPSGFFLSPATLLLYRSRPFLGHSAKGSLSRFVGSFLLTTYATIYATLGTTCVFSLRLASLFLLRFEPDL